NSSLLRKARGRAHCGWVCGFAVVPYFHTSIRALVERLSGRKEIKGSRYCYEH
ncbi:hypothetical protein H0E87_031138, partial [Populus deltoides]